MTTLTALVAALLLVQQQAPPRDAPHGGGTATLRGRVLAGDTGAPIRSAIVMLSSVDGNNASANASTDERGRFEFAHLNAGAVRLMARPPDGRARWLTTSFGAPSPDATGRLIEIGDGETRERLDITLPLAATIEGRVLDDAGEPVADVSMQLVRVCSGGLKGETVGYRLLKTDDLGRFRIYGVSEGDYLVVARPESFSLPLPVSSPKLVATYYPSTTNQAEAQPVHVKAGQQLEGVEIQMVRAATYRISGMVVDSQGRPVANRRGSLNRYSGNSSQGGYELPLDAAGHFALADLEPGEFEIIFPPDSRSEEFARVAVTVSDDDIDNLVIATKPAADVNGRIVLDPPGASKLPAITVLSRAMFHGHPGHGDVRVPVGADGTFVLSHVANTMLVRVDAPAGWWLKAVLLKGEDVTDTPVEFGARDSGKLEVVVTTRASALDVRVADDRAEPVRDGAVVLFPADPAAWVAESSRTRLVELKGSSTVRLAGLRAGKYLIVAAPYDRLRYWNNRNVLETLARDATEVVLGEDEQRVVDLKLKLRPPDIR
jgi:Carboxypeptidase regulatory-like domain